jgi:Mg-chelatase subunit ChlD
VSGDKVAVPDTITLGEEVTVRLTLDIRCRAGEEPRADIMLILDRSNSMGDGSLPGTKLYEAKAAAHEFVRQIDLTRHRLGLVSFSEIISLDQPLTTDAAAVHAAIDAVQISGLTDIATALERANEHIALARRPEALPVLLLLSDGKPLQPGQPYVDTARQGARARARGLLVYAIGLGADVDAALLTAVAGSGQRYFFAPRPEDLQPIYARLSESVGDVVARDVEIVDEMGPDVDFVAGSASDGPTVAGNRLTWGFATLGGTKTMTLRVKPRRTGRLPTNTQAVARHVAEGVPYSFTFPVPQVRVLDAPTATPTLTATPLPTATPTRRPSTPSRVFLPILMRDLCRLKDAQLGADIVLVIDTSSSMTGAKLEAAKAAARVFLALVDPDRDRVGLVSFDGTARRDYLITADLAGVARSLGNLSLGQGSRIDLGLVEARTELGRRARRGSQRVVVLLSDGLPTPGYEGATRSAAAVLTGTGSTLFTVGLGADASGPLLRGLASTPLHYYAAPNPADLELIYRRIARSLPCR